MAATALEGIFPALLTAFDPHEEIDWTAQRTLLRRLLGEGVHGFFVGGTSGELPFLSLDERERLAEAAAEECRGRASIIVHVGAPRPRDAVRLARHAEAHGAIAVSAVPPYYYSYREAAVVDYVREVAGATSLPFIYYHIPARTGVALDEALALELLAVPNLRGVKYSALDLAFQERLKAWGGPGFAVFCGADEMLLASLAMGAAGAIGSTYNFLAPGFLRLWRAFRAGQLGEAQRLQVDLNRVITVLSRYPNVAVAKEALRLVGLDLGRPRRPQSQITDDERARLAAELRAAGFPAER